MRPAIRWKLYKCSPGTTYFQSGHRSEWIVCESKTGSMENQNITRITPIKRILFGNIKKKNSWVQNAPKGININPKSTIWHTVIFLILLSGILRAQPAWRPHRPISINAIYAILKCHFLAAIWKFIFYLHCEIKCIVNSSLRETDARHVWFGLTMNKCKTRGAHCRPNQSAPLMDVMYAHPGFVCCLRVMPSMQCVSLRWYYVHP